MHRQDLKERIEYGRRDAIAKKVMLIEILAAIETAVGEAIKYRIGHSSKPWVVHEQ